MSGKFHGFSQDYIEKLKSNPKTTKENRKEIRNVIATIAKYSVTLAVDRPNIAERTRSQPPAKAAIIKPQQHQQQVKPQIPKPPANNDNETSVDTSNNPLHDALHFKPLPTTTAPAIEEIVELQQETVKPPVNASSNPMAFKGVSLKDYESQRRMVEEQNKHKKQILYRAIEQQWVFCVSNP